MRLRSAAWRRPPCVLPVTSHWMPTHGLWRCVQQVACEEDRAFSRDLLKRAGAGRDCAVADMRRTMTACPPTRQASAPKPPAVTGRGWMSTGATGLDWTTGGD